MEPEVSQGQGAPRLGRFVAACESGERDNNLERFELFEREVVGGKGLNLAASSVGAGVIICAREINGILARAPAGLQERAVNVTKALQARWMTGATVYRPSHPESGSFLQMLSTQGDDPCKSSSWSR